jgi:NADPH:quinone reductase-like Zn-dependent oxidoreductase
MLALLLAKAAGCEVIITSSDDAKLERAKALGADHGVNYKQHTDWGIHIAKAFGGVDKVVEVGGAGTAEQSMMALRHNGEVSMIGVLSPVGGPNPRGLMMTGSIMRGIFVGSRRMAEKMADAFDANALKPVIGATFGMDQAREAFDYVSSPALFGKAVITLN